MGRLTLPPEGLEYFSGDRRRITINVEGLDLTGYTVRFTLFDFDGVPLFTKTTADSSITIGPGLFRFLVLPTDTANLEGDYDFASDAFSATDGPYMLAHGKFRILADKPIPGRSP